MRTYRRLSTALAVFVAGCAINDSTNPFTTESAVRSGATATASERLDLPSVVSVRLAGGRATVTWRQVLDARGYQLVGCDSGQLPAVEKLTARDTVQAYDGLVPGMPYGVKLRTRKVTGTASGDANNSKFSECKRWVGAEPVASIILVPTSANLMVGDALRLSATLLDRSGMVLTDRDLAWQTSAPAVASVATNGTVTAVGAGTSTITVASEGTSASTTLEIREPVASVSVSPFTMDLDVGVSAVFFATASDRFGNPLTGRAISWSSSEPGVVTITADGRATGVSPGGALVYATSEGVQGAASVRVTSPVAAMDLIADEVLDPVQHIVTFKADGSQRRIITDGVHPTWVGNLVLARGAYQDNRIFSMSSDGSNRRLIIGAGPSYVPDLSPNAARVTLVYGDCGRQHRIATANADGTDLRLLGPCGSIPRWSPAEDRIAFTSAGDLYSIRSDGANQRQIAVGTSALAASWSPDGRALVFDSYSGGRGRLMVINADGSSLRPLLPPEANASDEFPDWSPDGQWIAFRSSRSGKYEIWRVRSDGTGLTRVTSTPLPQGLVRWRR